MVWIQGFPEARFRSPRSRVLEAVPGANGARRSTIRADRRGPQMFPKNGSRLRGLGPGGQAVGGLHFVILSTFFWSRRKKLSTRDADGLSRVFTCYQAVNNLFRGGHAPVCRSIKNGTPAILSADRRKAEECRGNRRGEARVESRGNRRDRTSDYCGAGRRQEHSATLWLC